MNFKVIKFWIKNTSYDIPDVKTEDDFTIIYKGRDDIENNAKYKENIIEIKISWDELLRKLRYFKSRSNELKYLNEYYIHDEFHVDIFQKFIDSIKTNKIDLNEENYLVWIHRTSRNNSEIHRKSTWSSKSN